MIRVLLSILVKELSFLDLFQSKDLAQLKRRFLFLPIYGIFKYKNSLLLVNSSKLFFYTFSISAIIDSTIVLCFDFLRRIQRVVPHVYMIFLLVLVISRVLLPIQIQY